MWLEYGWADGKPYFPHPVVVCTRWLGDQAFEQLHNHRSVALDFSYGRQDPIFASSLHFNRQCKASIKRTVPILTYPTSVETVPYGILEISSIVPTLFRPPRRLWLWKEYHNCYIWAQCERKCSNPRGGSSVIIWGISQISDRECRKEPADRLNHPDWSKNYHENTLLRVRISQVPASVLRRSVVDHEKKTMIPWKCKRR